MLLVVWAESCSTGTSQCRTVDNGSLSPRCPIPLDLPSEHAPPGYCPATRGRPQAAHAAAAVPSTSLRLRGCEPTIIEVAKPTVMARDIESAHQWGHSPGPSSAALGLGDEAVVSQGEVERRNRLGVDTSMPTAWFAAPPKSGAAFGAPVSCSAHSCGCHDLAPQVVPIARRNAATLVVQDGSDRSGRFDATR